ncbi:MAG: PilZ domain-containing protein [Sedimentisphaerales bacterium]|nr:PilZ domain-containing protein [Sedimentisphaerales bacterium]
MDRHEKRTFQRLGATYEISCRRIGSQTSQACEGFTENVSPGGVYFRTKTETFKQGDLLKIELSIPPKQGILEFGGKMTGFAKVLRADTINRCSPDDTPSDRLYGVALQFCRPLKLCV